MRKKKRLIQAGLLLAAMVYFSSCAQNREQNRGRNVPSSTMQNAPSDADQQGDMSYNEQNYGYPGYNPENIESIRGRVINIMRVHVPRGKGYHVQLMLNTEKGNIAVDLGPGWYVEGGPIQLQLYDEVEVTGSFIYNQGQAFLIASELKRGRDLLQLRDDKGYPLWSGWKRS